MSTRTGRPVKGESKRDVRLQLRLSADELRLIDECAERSKQTKVGVVVQGAQLVKQKLDEQQK